MIAYNVFCGSWNEFSCLQPSVAINQCHCRPRELCWFTPGKAAFTGASWILWAFAVSSGVWSGQDCVPFPEKKTHLFPLGSQSYVLSSCHSHWWQIAFPHSNTPKPNRSSMLQEILVPAPSHLLPCLSNSFTAQENGFVFGMLKLFGSVINSDTKAVLLEEKSRVNHRKGSFIRNSRLLLAGPYLWEAWLCWLRSVEWVHRLRREKQDLFIKAFGAKTWNPAKGQELGWPWLQWEYIVPIQQRTETRSSAHSTVRKKICVFSTLEKCPEIVRLSENITSGIVPRSARPWFINSVNVHINSSCQTLTCPAEILWNLCLSSLYFFPFCAFPSFFHCNLEVQPMAKQDCKALDFLGLKQSRKGRFCNTLK